MNSTAIAAFIFLPCAPVAMAICYWRGRRREERDLAMKFADEVEFNLIVRTRGH